ncbi:MAG: hypothetical protein JJE29_08260 [Peptostreptococcaceae bacterium]|nr:hypothetical protein [Peptostreptococcaceae bacterium]
MEIASRSEVLEILEMPRDEFWITVKNEAKAVHRGIGGGRNNGDRVFWGHF